MPKKSKKQPKPARKTPPVPSGEIGGSDDEVSVEDVEIDEDLDELEKNDDEDVVEKNDF